MTSVPTTDWRSALAGKTILVTGARGYLGSTLVATLAKECACSVLGMSRQQFMPFPGTVAICGDPRRREAWSIVQDVDVIFHLAGETSTYRAEENPAASLEANVLPMVLLLEACRRCHSGHVPTVILAGTATEVGAPTALPVNESVPDQPITFYDLHKLTAERHLALAAARGWIKGGTLRLANVYGPAMTAAGSADRGILNRIIRQALKGGPITIFGDGSQLRDYVYIDDVIRAFVAAAVSALGGRYYLVGSGVSCPFGKAFRMAARLAEEKTGRPVQIDERPWPAETSAIEFRNFEADTSRFSGLTGWRATTALDKGIRKTVEAFA